MNANCRGMADVPPGAPFEGWKLWYMPLWHLLLSKNVQCTVYNSCMIMQNATSINIVYIFSFFN